MCKEVGTLFHRPRSGVTINSFGSRTLIVVSHLGNQSANYKSNIIGRQAQCPCSIAFVKGTRCAWNLNTGLGACIDLGNKTLNRQVRLNRRFSLFNFKCFNLVNVFNLILIILWSPFNTIYKILKFGARGNIWAYPT